MVIGDDGIKSVGANDETGNIVGFLGGEIGEDDEKDDENGDGAGDNAEDFKFFATEKRSLFWFASLGNMVQIS